MYIQIIVVICSLILIGYIVSLFNINNNYNRRYNLLTNESNSLINTAADLTEKLAIGTETVTKLSLQLGEMSAKLSMLLLENTTKAASLITMNQNYNKYFNK